MRHCNLNRLLRLGQEQARRAKDSHARVEFGRKNGRRTGMNTPKNLSLAPYRLADFLEERSPDAGDAPADHNGFGVKQVDHAG